MKTKFVTLMFITTVLSSVLTLVSCSKEDVTGTQPNSNTASTAKNSSSSMNGVGSAIPAYYDAKLFNIIFIPFSPQASATLIAQNPGINFIYQSDPGLPDAQPFISVIDAIPTDGMNPVWQEVQITFINGVTPYQLFSDDEIADAVTNHEISLDFTDEVYKCPIIGKH